MKYHSAEVNHTEKGGLPNVLRAAIQYSESHSEGETSRKKGLYKQDNFQG